MTSNFLSFKEFVQGKFESMSNFSFLVTGSFQSYKGLENKADTNLGRSLIDQLYQDACELEFDKEKCEVSDFDRLAIKARMNYFIFEEGYKNPAQWLIAHKISEPYYSAVINGRIVRKNCAYERLIKLMGLT